MAKHSCQILSTPFSIIFSYKTLQFYTQNNNQFYILFYLFLNKELEVCLNNKPSLGPEQYYHGYAICLACTQSQFNPYNFKMSLSLPE